MSGFHKAKARIQQFALRLKAVWADTLIGGLAAGLAWFVSANALHHTNPLFATMAALVCLSPGLASHSKQAFYLLIGVTVGVIVGECALLFPPIPTPVRIGLVAFIASLLAASYAIVPVLIIQSGMAAVMVFAMGPQVAGFSRLADVALGASIGLIFSQILFTPDPMKSLTVSAELFFGELADIFDTAAEAIKNNDEKAALSALNHCNTMHSSLVTLAGSVTSAHETALWSLRGRISSREVTSLAWHYNRAAIRLYASGLLFCESLISDLKKQSADAPPPWFIQSLRINAENCRFLAGESKSSAFIRQDRSGRAETPLSWRDCANSLHMVENALAHFYKSTSRRARLQSFRKKRSSALRKEEIHMRGRKREKPAKNKASLF